MPSSSHNKVQCHRAECIGHTPKGAIKLVVHLCGKVKAQKQHAQSREKHGKKYRDQHGPKDPVSLERKLGITK